ncbi:MAG: tetratricopeptide repeat protein [Propionibacteriaceae bacterium]|jgi:tetratricopeptide (TPR) repeat protein|nr:tetratricopeptide repeat protein [Propionibacteriaceae bacterium]
MGLVFDLAELINAGLGVVGGEGATSIRERINDASLRRAISKAFSTVLDNHDDILISSRQKRKLAKDDLLVRWLCQDPKQRGECPIDAEILDGLDTDTNNKLLVELHEAFIEAICPRLSTAEQLSLRTLLKIDRELLSTHSELGDVKAIVEAIWRERQNQRPEPLSQIAGSRPLLSADFVARDEMAALKSALGDGGQATLCALKGMRGVGKSWLASAYAKECEKERWSFVGWINAGSREQAITEMAKIAALLGQSEQDDPPDIAASRLVTWLNQTGTDGVKDKLLVFDNVERRADLEDLIPTSPGTRVLVTTTHQEATFGTAVDVSAYSTEEAVEYLVNATGLSDRVDAGKVAKELGNLPVALTQAAAVIRNRGYTFEQYLDRLKQAVLDEVVKPFGDYPYAANVALWLAFTTVVETCGKGNPAVGRAALGVMEVLSLLAESGVPRNWLYAVGENEDAAREAVGDLVESSVLIESEDKSIVSLHRLMGRVVREDDPSEHRAGEAVQYSARVLAAVDVDLIGDYMGRRSAITSLGAQLVAIHEQQHSKALVDSKEFLATVHRVASVAIEHEDPFTTIALADYQTDLMRVLGADHPDTLTSRHNLAAAYESAGDVGKAIRLFEETLADKLRVLGADHPDTLTSRNNLAGAYRSAGDVGKAIPLHEQTLADRVRVLGADHPDTLTSRNNLAFAYQSAGDVGKAIPLYEETLADCVRVLGADHPTTLTLRSNLAGAFRLAGDIPETDQRIT